MSKKLFIHLLFFAVIFGAVPLNAQKFVPIKGWSKEVNQRIETFLNSKKHYEGRKVAVFDCDGTVFGQVPYYLADEALYMYADENYKGKTDSLSLKKLAILNRMVENGDNVSKEYVEDRVHFLSGLTADQIRQIGADCYQKSYKGRIYPEMKKLIANLKNYGFEVWILTASPELLYQKFVSEELNIPMLNIVGVKSVIENGVSSGTVIMPIPQDDGKGYTIETFIQAKPLIVGGNSRGDLDMLNLSSGLKIVVNPDNSTIRPKEDGVIAGHTVKTYWEQNDGIIVYCKDSVDPGIGYHTEQWKIRRNKDTSNPQ
ncbi:MAG: haloacid dehalogenase-like hydrolase [Dysgonamonadaceae bacterium]|jgi:phosphoserine phosphatase|nr:haloacid dehalogenase-like hydrolase [Dysgonamonadaceae bacterium]